MDISEFQLKISQTGKPVIVDFWAPWCMPCRFTKPILEKLAREYAPNVEFVEINAEEAREILHQFHIVGIPTVLALRDGRIAGRVTGAQNEAGYRAMFESLVNGKEVRVSLSLFDRLLRLTAGMLLMLIGISISNWFVVGTGGIVAFLGIYDRCPLWKAIIKRLCGCL